MLYAARYLCAWIPVTEDINRIFPPLFFLISIAAAWARKNVPDILSCKSFCIDSGVYVKKSPKVVIPAFATTAYNEPNFSTQVDTIPLINSISDASPGNAKQSPPLSLIHISRAHETPEHL